MAKQPADNPMIGIVMKSLGIDPAGLLDQARNVGAVIEELRAGQVAIRTAQSEMMAMLSTLQTALGVAPPPTDTQLALIATESRKFMEPAA